MAKIKKSRHWAFVMYPDSMPSNWQEIIQESGLACAISPLHDKDINPDGEVKKEHYHVLASYDGPTTYNNVLEFTKKLNATIPIDLQSVRGMYRYHLHLDNPEKYQYDISDIVGHGGVDVSAMLAPSASERRQVLREMLNFIRDNDITCYSDFVDYCLVENSVWFEAISEHATYVVKEYIKSRSWKKYQRPLLEAASKQSY